MQAALEVPEAWLIFSADSEEVLLAALEVLQAPEEQVGQVALLVFLAVLAVLEAMRLPELLVLEPMRLLEPTRLLELLALELRVPL